MICGVVPHPTKFPANHGLQARGGGAPAAAPEVSGTWDFKWPLGTRIRVAWAGPDLPDPGYQQAKQLVQDYAETWNRGSRIGPGTGIWLHFTGDVVSPSPAQVDAPYDVLVSLAPIGYVGATGANIQDRLPRSDLGSYARRQDLRKPTIHLGPIGTFGDWAAHYRLDEKRYAVIHEFGHVLGLAHENQNPLTYQGPVDAADYGDTFRVTLSRFGINCALTNAELDLFRIAQTDRWPGNVEFSDWRKDHDPKSVMRVAYSICNGRSCEARRALGKPCHCFKGIQAPSDSDYEHLAAMYRR